MQHLGEGFHVRGNHQSVFRRRCPADHGHRALPFSIDLLSAQRCGSLSLSLWAPTDLLPPGSDAWRNGLRKTLILFAFPLLLLSAMPSLASSFKVTRVHDGETVRAEGHGIEIVVRLAGIEVPRSMQQGEPPLALEAKSHLAELILNKTVEIQGHGLDEMNRVLGIITIQRRNVNLEMIKAGYARVYRGDPPHPLYLLPFVKAEEAAKRYRKGIWAEEAGTEAQRQSQAAP